ncbi:response regulator transcription factor [Myxococcota bacterium]|nr:response regulator transcription factor [Myxococcota bacterium]
MVTSDRFVRPDRSCAKHEGGAIRVMVVDDHEIFRQGLEQLIGAEEDMIFAGGAACAGDALAILGSAAPDVIILDLSLRGRSGLDTLKDIRAVNPDAAFLILTVHDENLFAERALRAGARGFVMKDHGAARVIQGVREIAAGRFFFSPEISQKFLAAIAGQGRGDDRLPMDRLTDRELVVFELLGRGMSSRQIAGELNLSVKTIDAHRENIKKKLNIPDAQELLRRAVLWVQELNIA